MKKISNEEFIISLSDLWTAIKRGKKKILIAALLVGALFFYRQIHRPINFTAEGMFKGGEKKTPSSLIATLLGGSGESFSSEDDPKTFLHSYPVLARVVDRLHLQGCLVEAKKPPSRFKNIWDTVRAESIHKIYGAIKRPSSPILSGNVAIPDTLPFPDQKHSVQCQDIRYDQETFTNVSIKFQDEQRFTVSGNQGKILGQGELSAPFVWERGSFTLEKLEERRLSGSLFHLSLIPLEPATKSLEDNLSITSDKKNASLYKISYTHRDRQLATSIVNAVMQEYSNYQHDQGENIISKQLQYLATRQQQTTEELDKIINQHKLSLEKTIGEGGFVTLESELGFIAKTQVEYQSQLAHLTSMMQGLSSKIYDGNFPKLIEKIREENNQTSEVFTIQAAEAMLASYQSDLDKIDFEKEYLNFSLSKLAEPTFDVATLTKSDTNPTVAKLFAIVHDLQLKLIDEKNWSTTERGNLRAEIELQKKFLIQHFENLKAGAEVQKNVLQQKIHSLKQNALVLLYNEYEIIEHQLRDLAERATHFPEKKFSEQKIALNTKMQNDVFESITKMIESKNISFNLEYNNSYPLAMAIPPTLPNHPRIRFFTLIGACIGAFGAFGALLLLQAAKGPSASLKNLRGMGYHVSGLFSAKNNACLKEATYFLSKNQTLLISSQHVSSLSSQLAARLAKRKDRVCVIQLAKSASKSGLVDYLLGKRDDLPWQKNVLPWGKGEEFKEELLGTQRFQDLLDSLKQEYDYILLENAAHPLSVETSQLAAYADAALYLVTKEQLSDVSGLPEKTTFLLKDSLPEKEFASTFSYLQERKNYLKLQLRQLEPLLDALKERFNFSPR
ncbi:MAG: hypothetical protein KR126chlam2_01120 [Chlamydiae bacterium]|nr:hypothetical protein [Chlamydiota bacterium]